MFWLTTFILFIAFQPGILFAFPPIIRGTVSITTIVVHALFFGVIVTLLNQYSESKIEGYQAATACRDDGTNIGSMVKAICEANLPANPMDTIFTNTKESIRQLRELPKTSPFYDTYSKSYNIIHPEAALATEQPEGFTNYATKEGFATSIKAKVGHAAILGGLFAGMSMVGCFQGQISCGIANSMGNGGQDCSIQAQNPQQLNAGNPPMTLATRDVFSSS
jgi:hypothetical protein